MEELRKDKFIQNKTISFIIDLVLEILIEHIDEPNLFISYLISLTLLNKDVDPDSMIFMSLEMMNNEDEYDCKQIFIHLA